MQLVLSNAYISHTATCQVILNHFQFLHGVKFVYGVSSLILLTKYYYDDLNKDEEMERRL